MEPEKYLVIHVDHAGVLDVAEVTASNAADAAEEVEGYADTAAIEFVIGFTGNVPTVYLGDGEPVKASEGNALDASGGERGLENSAD